MGWNGSDYCFDDDPYYYAYHQYYDFGGSHYYDNYAYGD